MSLEEELDELRELGYSITPVVQPDGWTMVVFDGFPLPSGYNRKTSRLLVKVPPGHPSAKLDMFWMDSELKLESGNLPQGCSQEQALGMMWLRFSWHASNWNPGYDNLRTYLSFIKTRLKNRS